MEAVIFIGIQGAGKSTFYKQFFVDTHIRINLDMLKTRHREELLLKACLEAKQPFVVDKMNASIVDRARYIQAAKAYNFRVVGYYFRSNFEECLERNNQREGKAVVPEKGLRGFQSRFQMPSYSEGFDALFHVKIGENREFIVTEWKQ
jgi:predicted kinase